MRRRLLILLILFIVGNVGNLFICDAYFSDNGPGAGVRPMGMGGAYVALADDANALFWNASGLSRIETREFIASYSTLFYGLDLQLYDGSQDQLGYHLIGYVHPLKTASMPSGIGVGGIFFNSKLYSEQLFNFGYSLKLAGVAKEFRLGLNLKLLRLNLQENEYVKLDSDLSNLNLSKIGNSIDLSALYTLNSLSFGATIENLRPVDMGLIETERIPMKVSIGAAHSLKRTSQSLEISYRDSKVNDTGDFNLKIGVEHWALEKLLALRAGYNFRFATAGFGLRYKNSPLDLQLDYATLYPIASIVDSYGSHRVAIIVRF